jgi:hypothetical protein
MRKESGTGLRRFIQQVHSGGRSKSMAVDIYHQGTVQLLQADSIRRDWTGLDWTGLD